MKIYAASGAYGSTSTVVAITVISYVSKFGDTTGTTCTRQSTMQ